MTYEELENENKKLKQELKDYKAAYEVARDLAFSYAERATKDNYWGTQKGAQNNE